MAINLDPLAKKPVNPSVATGDITVMNTGAPA